MDDSVSEVKSKIDIASLISEYVDLKKAGRNFKAPCPFHPEKTPSFVVSPELQIFKCFGCGESGDVFAFLEKYEGMDFYEALKYLADKAGVKLEPRKFDQAGQKEKLYKINSDASYFYKYVLLKHPAGKDAYNYLVRERRLTPSTIDTFGIGFSPDSPYALKKFLLDKKKIPTSDLERSGLIYKTSRGDVDRFRGRIIFPLMDHRGNIVGFAGRILPSQKSGDLAKYINSPETDVYHKSKVLFGLNITRPSIKKKNEAVVVEGELDMISSYQAGIDNVVAIKGSALTSEQAKLLSRFTSKVVLCLDTDFAGNEAARRGLSVLQQEGLEVTVAQLNGFKDPDEAAHKSPEELKKSLKNAKVVWDFVIDNIFAKHPSSSETGIVSKEAVPFLASITDEIVRAHYINVLANRLNVPNEAVKTEVVKFLDKDDQGQSLAVVTAKDQEQKIVTRRDLLEDRLLSLMFKSDPVLILDKKYQKLFESTFALRIIEELNHYFDKRKKFDLESFSKSLPSELFHKFSEIILGEPDDVDIENVENIKKELLTVERELNLINIRVKLEKVTNDIKLAEMNKDEAQLKKSQILYSKLSKKLNTLAETGIKGIIS